MRKKSNNITYEVLFKVRTKRKGAEELLKAIIVKNGIRPQEIVESSIKKSKSISVFLPSVKQTKAIEKDVLRSAKNFVRVNIKKLPEKSWRDKWKEDFNTFRLTKTIDVVPSWQKPKYKAKKREPIFIDSTNVFGTGLHETTRFMANLIERKKGKFLSFLDIGTGTGILSLVANVCGADQITAIENDSACIKIMRDNLRKNKCSAKIKVVDAEKFNGKRKFDFVAANIVTYDLIRLKRKIVSFVAPGGFLAISGISLEYEDKIKAAFKMPFLRCVKVKRGKQWIALLYKRKNRN